MNAKNIIIFIAVLAILYVFLMYSGIPIPAPIMYIIMIVGLALFCIYAIKFLQSNA